MAEIWFNETGYLAKSNKGEASFRYDLPDHMLNDASALYIFRWTVLNRAMEDMKLLLSSDKEELNLHTDSRLVEEIDGDVVTDHRFAQSSLLYLITQDGQNFSKIRSHKESSMTINNKLRES